RAGHAGGVRGVRGGGRGRERSALPVEIGQLRPDAAGKRQVARLQVARDCGRDFRVCGSLLGRALRRFGAGAEARDEIRFDLRQSTARVRSQIGFDRLQLGPGGLAPASALRLADALKNPLAAAHSSAFTKSSTTFLASPNTIMVLSM